MSTTTRRVRWAGPVGLLALAMLAACSGEEPKVATPAATTAPTQVVGATPTAAPKAAATTAPWPQREAKLPILGAVPNAAPRVTPTPLPPGVTATPPPPAATPKPPIRQDIVFYVDTVTSGAGESPFNVDANLNCVRSSVFSRGMHITWRLTAFDNTGTELQTATMESLVLKLPDGKTANFRYGRHGSTDDSPWFWTATWDVPMDFPLGTVDWSVEAKTKSGLTGAFKELEVFTLPGAERVTADGTRTRSDSRTTIVN